jgi:hypothetical protein
LLASKNSTPIPVPPGCAPEAEDYDSELDFFLIQQKTTTIEQKES